MPTETKTCVHCNELIVSSALFPSWRHEKTRSTFCHITLAEPKEE